MTSYDLTKTAEDFRREAKRDDYRARRDAQRAESYYRTARQTRQHLAWLTRRPDMWDEDGTTPRSWPDTVRTLGARRRHVPALLLPRDRPGHALPEAGPRLLRDGRPPRRRLRGDRLAPPAPQPTRPP